MRRQKWQTQKQLHLRFDFTFTLTAADAATAAQTTAYKRMPGCLQLGHETCQSLQIFSPFLSSSSQPPTSTRLCFAALSIFSHCLLSTSCLGSSTKMDGIDRMIHQDRALLDSMVQYLIVDGFTSLFPKLKSDDATDQAVKSK
jgi:hypothetical protein